MRIDTNGSSSNNVYGREDTLSGNESNNEALNNYYHVKQPSINLIQPKTAANCHVTTKA
jgi:hypothetical protein